MKENFYYSRVFNSYFVGDMIPVCKKYEKAFDEFVDTLDYDDPTMTLRIQEREMELEDELLQEALIVYKQESEQSWEVFDDGEHSKPKQ